MQKKSVVKKEANYYTQPHADGSYGVKGTLSMEELHTISTSPMSDWARKLFTHQITINSQPRVIIRGKRVRQTHGNA
jgi:hypothetical protein